MRQFDVYRNPSPASARDVPWLLVIQSDLLEEFPTRVVAPLVRPRSLRQAASRLNPSFKVDGETAVMLTQQLGAVPTRSLKHRAGSLASQRAAIIGAIDFLLSGV